MDKFKVTLNDLERNNIIAKMKEPVDWVSNLIIVEKPDNCKLQDCVKTHQILMKPLKGKISNIQVFKKILNTLFWHDKLLLAQKAHKRILISVNV